MTDPRALDPTTMPLPPLTLIVAATTPTMGIGLRGTLPWTGLKREMAYFARVTKRAPSSPSSTATGTTTANAVIMGRKTWESIPPQFRPLKGRTNIVVSRSPENLKRADEECVLAVGSIREGLQALRRAEQENESKQRAGRVFVIGGAEIYRAALRMEECRRILLTRIRTEFECDTFFPVELGGGGEGGWIKRGKERLDEWVGEEVPSGVQVEGGVEYEFEMWEREGGG